MSLRKWRFSFYLTDIPGNQILQKSSLFCEKAKKNAHAQTSAFLHISRDSSHTQKKKISNDGDFYDLKWLMFIFP